MCQSSCQQASICMINAAKLNGCIRCCRDILQSDGGRESTSIAARSSLWTPLFEYSRRPTCHKTALLQAPASNVARCCRAAGAVTLPPTFPQICLNRSTSSLHRHAQSVKMGCHNSKQQAVSYIDATKIKDIDSTREMRMSGTSSFKPREPHPLINFYDERKREESGSTMCTAEDMDEYSPAYELQ